MTALQTSDPRTNVTRTAGWILIASSFAIPQIEAIKLGAGAAGYKVVESLFALLVPGLAAYLVTRKRSDFAKAIGTLLVGIFCLGLALTVQAQDSETRKEHRAYIDKAIEIQGRYAKEIETINLKQGGIDLGAVVTAQALVDKAERAKARAAIGEYGRLTQQRIATIESQVKEAEALVMSVSSAEFRQGALPGMEKARRNNEALWGALHKAQLGYVSAIERIFDFAEKNQGRLRLQNGQIMYPDKPTQDEGVRNAQQLDDAGNALQKAFADAAVAERRISAENEANKQRGKSLTGQ